VTQPTSAVHQNTSESLRSNTHLVVAYTCGQVAAGRVQNAFRLAGRPGGVQDVERIFRIHRFGRAFLRRARHQLRPPHVATGLERHRLTCPTQHHDVPMVGVAVSASSAFCFSGTIAPRR